MVIWSFLIHLLFCMHWKNVWTLDFEGQVDQICYMWTCLLQTLKWIKVKDLVIDPLYFEWVSRWNIRLGIFKSKKVCFDRKHRKCYFSLGVSFKAYHPFCLENVQIQLKIIPETVPSENSSLIWDHLVPLEPSQVYICLEFLSNFVIFVSSTQILEQIVSKSESKIYCDSVIMIMLDSNRVLKNCVKLTAKRNESSRSTLPN